MSTSQGSTLIPDTAAVAQTSSRASCDEAGGAARQFPRIGFHAPIAGGLQNALLKAKERGCETVQIFSRNPRGWKARALTEEEAETFRRVRDELGIHPVVIHANYLINLAVLRSFTRRGTHGESEACSTSN
ncbi:MAG: hypothetical protein LC802_12695 [Acidobacteria bacterium]|nr:hypothetical protein [Acidobacteriota bacterium]